MDFFDEINSSKSLFLLKIKEPRDNQVLITVQETTVSDESEIVSIGNTQIGPLKRIIVNDKCTKYSLFFNSYAAYSVINESFSPWKDYEEWVGNLFRFYTKSNYLDFIRKDTNAEFIYEYQEGKLKHFSIICENHVINIASIDFPIIKRVL
jgi:hypothetical protein